MVLPVQPNIPKSHLQELLHSVRLLRRHHVIVRLILLQHHPHCLHVIPSESPIPRRLQIPQKQLVLQPNLDPSHGPCNFPRDEILSPPRRFVVEQDPVAGVQPIGLTVVHRVPVRGTFGRRVRRSRVKWSGFGLRRRCRSEHFGGSGLVIPDIVPPSGGDVRSHCLEEAEGSSGHDISCVIGNLEGHSDVRLGGEIVDLVWANSVDPPAKRGSVGEVSIMKLHASFVRIVRVDVDVIDSLSIEIGGATDQSVHLVALVEEEFSQVRTILASYAGDQSHLEWLRHLSWNGPAVALRGGGSGSRRIILGRH
ncbi:phytase family [Tripterygium wilfordii]|uniref:Phytase family n=1 Tax=Tripterygium wilfordii TaxID=458696 RepID=A0A7J7CPE3_TRIWF|nr:phytase family [Tripterygium wilfordii]